MISNDKKKELSEEILSSAIFKKAPKSSSLLRYLVKSTLAGDYLKEDIIDLEFFGKKTDTSKTTPRVRVNVYNLRKKLDKYYETVGKNSEWRLFIEKGQYNVGFEKQNLKRVRFSKLKPRDIVLILSTIILGCILVYKSLPPNSPKIWNSFFKNDKNTTVIIGDVFGIVGETITGQSGWTRDYKINNIEEYFSIIDKKPRLKETTKPSDYSYTTSMSAIAVKHISKIYNQRNTDFDVRFSSNTAVVDLKKGNLIYVGPLKNENKFISIFNDANPYFKVKDIKLYLENHPTLKNRTFITDKGGQNGTDFSIVSRFKGDLDNEYFLFFSNHDIGIKATIEHFTTPDSLVAFQKKHLVDKQNFTALFEAHGKERTNLKLKTLLVVPF